jgi:hypothetical protein
MSENSEYEQAHFNTHCLGPVSTCMHCGITLPEDGPRLCPEMNDDVDEAAVREAAPAPEPPECGVDGCEEPARVALGGYCSREHEDIAIHRMARELEGSVHE